MNPTGICAAKPQDLWYPNPASSPRSHNTWGRLPAYRASHRETTKLDNRDLHHEATTLGVSCRDFRREATKLEVSQPGSSPRNHNMSPCSEGCIKHAGIDRHLNKPYRKLGIHRLLTYTIDGSFDKEEKLEVSQPGSSPRSHNTWGILPGFSPRSHKT